MIRRIFGITVRRRSQAFFDSIGHSRQLRPKKDDIVDHSTIRLRVKFNRCVASIAERLFFAKARHCFAIILAVARNKAGPIIYCATETRSNKIPMEDVLSF